MEIISIIAILISPVIAVVIGQILQNKKEKNNRIYYNKFSVFATLLGARHSRANNDNFITAINQIPIVFSDNKKVLDKLEKFIKTSKDITLSEVLIVNSINSSLNDLVSEIGKDLNYPDLDNYSLKSFYSPDAAFFRNNSDLIYNQIYYHENVHRLKEVKEKFDTLNKQKEE